MDPQLKSEGAGSETAGGRMTCIYISRYAPERSPTDPYMALPGHLCRCTSFIGIWGPSKKLDPGFRNHSHKILEVHSGLLGWFESILKIVALKKDDIKSGLVMCGIDEHSLSLGLLASRILRLRLFCVVQDPPFTSRYDQQRSRLRLWEKRIRTALLRRLLLCCHGIFCFIEKDILREFHPPEDRIHQMMNGASFRALEWAQSRPGMQIADRNPIIAFIGAIHPVQGIEALLDIFSRARQSHPDLKLRLIGPMDPSYAPEFESCLRRLGIVSAVEVTGWLPYERMLGMLEECYAGVYCNPPSEWFLCAQPLKICEYLALGKPAVAWDYPGTRRLLNHGRLGMLIPSGDRAAFANALASLAGGPQCGQFASKIKSALENGWDSREWHHRVLKEILRSLSSSGLINAMAPHTSKAGEFPTGSLRAAK
jgi:glycosyltransferase involved in cell wall biosynthesis